MVVGILFVLQLLLSEKKQNKQNTTLLSMSNICPLQPERANCLNLSVMVSGRDKMNYMGSMKREIA